MVYRVSPAAMPWIMAIGAAAVSVLVLMFALTNHRSADRPVRRTASQALWMAAGVALAVLVLGSLGAM
jgi:uncharacterized membrane protein YsdA (DUF1294 family)